MANLTAQVIRLHHWHDGIWQVILGLPQQHPFYYQAGQYVEFVLTNGDSRPYSIANAPGNNQLEFHIHQLADHQFIEQLFYQLQQHKTIQLTPSQGQCVYRPSQQQGWLLLAGGTGLAPCKAMVEQAVIQSHCQPIYLYWGARTMQHLYLHAQLQQLAQQHHWLSYIPVLLETTPHYLNGWVHDAVIQAHPTLHQFEVYTSGPEAMVTTTKQQLLSHGLPATQFFSDYQ